METVLQSVFFEVKEEPEYHHEDPIEYTQTDDSGQCCCLCPEGIRLQEFLIEHLEKVHNDDNSADNFGQVLDRCNCNEGIQIQLDLIKHLLSHIPLALNNESELISVDPQEEIEEDTIKLQKIKSKPSYHQKYNRRDRSPNTLKVQQEFTQDDDSLLYHCNFCRNGYKHKQTVERHLSKEHYSNVAMKQPVEPFTIQAVTNKIIQTVHLAPSDDVGFTLEPEGKTFYCNFCRNAYKHKQTIERHLAKEHKVQVPKNKSSRFSIPSEVAGEVKEIRRRKKEKKFTCDKCGQHFLFRESLRKHLLRHIEPMTNFTKAGKTVREKIVCDQCTKLVHPSLMKRHFLVHHSDYRPFRCDVEGCKTSFFDITKYKDHQNIHLNVKPYICEFCQESFHYASNLRQHKLRHTHPDRFKCDVCLSCLVSTKSLRLHMRLHNADPDAPKPFACDQEGCDKVFKYLDRLKLHKFNVHRQESEHKCTLCAFTTNRKKYVKRHLLKVHNVREGNPRNRVFPISKCDQTSELSSIFGNK